MSISITETAAREFIMAALQSKAITLMGPSSKATAALAGAADAEYLKALLEGLTSQTPSAR
jgi:hypothetical protein